MTLMWLAIGVQLWMHASAVRDHLAVVNERGLRSKPSATTPFTMPYLPAGIDAQEWVMHAASLLDSHALQLRHTDIDNAPAGREVHWNTRWAWMIAGAGWIRQRLTGEPVTTALERATIWLNPAVLFTLIILLSAYTARRAGTALGLAIAIGMIGHDAFNDGFSPSFVDHHGLLTAAVLGMVLGALFTGGGWWKESDAGVQLLPPSPRAARTAATISAMCGALGMWVSASSLIAPIAMVGAAVVITTLASHRHAVETGAHFDAGVWRRWGRVGAVASLAFYLLEYAPFHLGLRLEVNNPLYAMAWWAGGEVIAQITERALAPNTQRWSNPRAFVAPLALLLVAPLTIVIGGAHVFAPSDPFLARAYSGYLLEYTPLWALRGGFSWNPYFSVVGVENLPLLVGIGVLAVRRRLAPPLVWFATLTTLALTAMAWIQMRWLDNASGPQICLALVLVAYFVRDRRPLACWATSLSVFGILFAPTAINRVVETRERVATRGVAPKEDIFMLYRDIAAALRASQPSGDITLLTDPNASVSIAYYGRFRAIGTMYWENQAGMKAAAEMYAAAGSDEAAALLRAHRVTHIAVISENDFTAAYYQTLHPEATEEDYDGSFGYQLSAARPLPAWLEAIPYSVPSDLAGLGITVRLYRVALERSVDDGRYRAALAKYAAGDIAGAERGFDALIAQDSTAYLPRLGKSELLFGRSEWSAAVDAALSGIAHAPVSLRTRLYGAVASHFLQQNRQAEAIRLYRAALNGEFDADIACSLSFVRATSGDSHLRDGAEALALARRAIATRSDSPMYLNCFGAALAETHHFAEAVAAVEHAAAVARAQGDANTARVSDALAAAFRTGKPWRE